MVVAPPLSETIALDVSGMRCAGCIKAVETELTQQPGVRSACVNLVTEVAVVECEPGQVDPETLAQALTQAGFPSQPRYPEGSEESQAALLELANRRQVESQQQLTRLAIALLLLFLSAIGHLESFTNFSIPGLSNIWFHCGLATVALLGPGRAMLIDGWQGLRRNAPNMNTLVSLGTLTAYSTSLIALLFPQLGWECFFDEPVMLVGFILLGRTLEQKARNRAASAFQALLALQPRVARLIPGNAQPAASASPNFIEIPVDRVRVGEWLQVLPGDTIPVDGKVVAGQTTVDEAMLTGEALPVLKQPGDWVTAGTINQSGTIALQTSRTGKDTTLAQIIALVETAQTRKAPIQKLADTVAGYFTYGVMGIATLTFLFWYFIGTHLWSDVLLQTHSWSFGVNHLPHHPLAASLPHHPTAYTPLLLSLKLAIAVLVVACPCALGLATPTAILVGSGIGAERGLLIRGGDVLERSHQLNAILLDKTGTLTTGKPVVTDCLSLLPSITPTVLLQLAATVETGARHPLAVAICQQAEQQGIALLPAQDFITEPGLGVAAKILLHDAEGLEENWVVRLGTEAWLTQYGIGIDAETRTRSQELAEGGQTVVFVAVGDKLAGLIAVADSLRADAGETVTALQKMGLAVYMLTGDRREAATTLAQTLNLSAEQVLAEVAPGDKATVVAQLQAEGQRVAMVGDGINDAPALAQANLGIALHSGTDVAVETADMIIMGDRLADVVAAIRLGKATFNKIRQNLFWAFAYNVVGIPLAAGVLLPNSDILLSPATAGAMMALSSVSVVTNSLLLYLTFPCSKSLTD
jgi:Cu2+-exporting ATPase